MYLTIRIGAGHKQILDILYIIYHTRTTCYGKYYPNGIDLYEIIGKCRDPRFITRPVKIIMSLPELKNRIDV